MLVRAACSVLVYVVSLAESDSSADREAVMATGRRHIRLRLYCTDWRCIDSVGESRAIVCRGGTRYIDHVRRRRRSGA